MRNNNDKNSVGSLTTSHRTDGGETMSYLSFFIAPRMLFIKLLSSCMMKKIEMKKVDYIFGGFSLSKLIYNFNTK